MLSNDDFCPLSADSRLVALMICKNSASKLIGWLIFLWLLAQGTAYPDSNSVSNKPKLSAAADVTKLELYYRDDPSSDQPKVIPSFRFRPIGPLTGQASFHVEALRKAKVLDVQIIFDLGRFSNIDDPGELGRKVKSIPTDKFSVWVLTEDGGALHLNEPPVLGGSGNADSGTGCLTFRFLYPNPHQALTVVLRAQGEYHVFVVTTN